MNSEWGNEQIRNQEILGCGFPGSEAQLVLQLKYMHFRSAVLQYSLRNTILHFEVFAVKARRMKKFGLNKKTNK